MIISLKIKIHYNNIFVTSLKNVIEMIMSKMLHIRVTTLKMKMKCSLDSIPIYIIADYVDRITMANIVLNTPSKNKKNKKKHSFK